MTSPDENLDLDESYSEKTPKMMQYLEGRHFDGEIQTVPKLRFKQKLQITVTNKLYFNNL